MRWLLGNWKWLTAIALAVFIFFAGYLRGADSVQRKWEREILAEIKAQLEKNQADAAKLKKLEETENANLVEIDRLRANNHALWMRLPKTPCGKPGETSTNSTTGAGELPTEAEIAFQRFREGLADEAYRADKIVENCRVLNDFMK